LISWNTYFNQYNKYWKGGKQYETVRISYI